MEDIYFEVVNLPISQLLDLIVAAIVNNRIQEMKHFDRRSMQKQWSIILLLYQAVVNHVLLQQYVSAIELLLIRHLAKLLMPLQTAALLWPSMENMQRFVLKLACLCST